MLMRLIDADALMEGRYIQRGEETVGTRNFVTFEEIEAAPTIEERKVEVTRCTDSIDRQAAIDILENVEILDGYTDCMELIDRFKNLPSTQPDVIRCKDCKHWDEITNMCGKTKRMALGVNGFCSRAERKDGEANDRLQTPDS